MRIAVCDDEPVTAELLRGYIEKYFSSAGMPTEIDVYLSAESLLSSQGKYTLCFVDCDLPGKNGIEAAKAMKRRSAACEIVFVSAYPRFVFDSYEVENIRFIIKPFDEATIKKTLDGWLHGGGARKPVFVTKDVCLPRNEIRYVEVENGDTVVVTRTAAYRSRKSLSDFESELGSSFYRVHRSFVVNMNFIARISEGVVTLDDGMTMNISRRAKTDFLKTYSKFLGSRR